jgi:hypothetical protein
MTTEPLNDPFPGRIGIGDGPESPCKVIAFDFARDGDAAAVVARRDANGVIHIDQMSPGGRAELIARFNEIGRQLWEQCEQVVRQLALVLRPVVDTIVALHHAFEDAGLYELDPDEIRIGLLEDEADDYAYENRDTPRHDLDVCAHICGGDPDHECAIAASTTVKYQNLAGGVAHMPTCRPCFLSETAAKERADA